MNRKKARSDVIYLTMKLVRLTACLSLLLLTACDKKASTKAGSTAAEGAAPTAAADPATAPPAAPAAAPAPGADPNQDLIDKYGSCEVTFEGDLQKTYRSPGGASALGSDYFMNEEETRIALKAFVGEAKVEEAMRRDPKIYTLIVNCGVEDLNLNFGAGTDSTYADIPFGPKKYEVGNGKGQMAMLGSVQKYGKYFRAKPGSWFEVTKFDGSGLQGAFELVIDGDLKGTVRGKIDYRCAHDTAICRAARGQ